MRCGAARPGKRGVAAADRCPAPPAWEGGRDGRKEGERASGGRGGAGLSRGQRAAGPHRRREAASLRGPGCPVHLRQGRGCRSAGRPALPARPPGGPVSLRGGRPFPRRRPAAGPLTCPPPGRAGAGGPGPGAGSWSESLPAPGPGGRPAPVRVGLGRKPFSDLRNRYLHVSSSDPGRYRSAAASFLSPGAARPGGSCRPSAPGVPAVPAAPAPEQMAAGCQVPTSPKGRGDLKSPLRPGSSACEIRSVLLFAVLFLSSVLPVYFSCPARQGIL